VTDGLYQLAEEHEELRAAVRALAEKEIAPYAAEVDDQGRYPNEAREALVKAGFHAITIPEEYGGEGADELAGVIVIEEVARICATSSLIPAVNGLGLTPILLSASDDLKRQVLPSIAAGEQMISYALSEREAGSDAASMRTRAHRDGDTWVLNGTKCWITNAGESRWYTVMAVTDPGKKAAGISAFVVHADDPGFEVGPKERKLGIVGSPTREIYFQNCTIPADRIIGAEGTGLRRRSPRSTTPVRRSGRRRSGSRRARSTWRSPTSKSASSSASTSPSSRACSSCSPTWR
jgi:alkylation response protein AidB-like acyl-CoA dehydrogenase